MYITLGKFTDIAPYKSNYKYMQIYYKSIKKNKISTKSVSKFNNLLADAAGLSPENIFTFSTKRKSVAYILAIEPFKNLFLSDVSKERLYNLLELNPEYFWDFISFVRFSKDAAWRESYFSVSTFDSVKISHFKHLASAMSDDTYFQLLTINL